MSEHYPVIVIGGGQSGLSISFELKQRGLDHVVLERHRVAHAWRAKRWDTFCLVTPNWQCKLPGYDYSGSEPHGFMPKDEIVRYIETYAASFAAPLREGVEVTNLAFGERGLGFACDSSDGTLSADQVVIAIGGYHVVVLPRMAERIPPAIVVLHSSDYKSPQALPEGEVLVVGTGQSGCQIAEDLHLAGRRVHLAVGSAPRVARRYRGKDVVEWLSDLGHYDLPVEKHPLKEGIRRRPNHYVTGRDGGHDIDLRQFALEGMQLYGRLRDVRDGALVFGDDLEKNLDDADAVSENIKTTIDQHIERDKIDAPSEARYVPVWKPRRTPLELDLHAANIASIVWSTGFAADFRWVQVPAFDGRGYPQHERGVTAVDGLYFLGLPWLHTWGSGRFSGIARDARHIADHIMSRYEAAGPERRIAGG